MSTHTKSGRRTVLQDNSWIRRNAEEDEPIDDDPNFGKVVLSQKKPVDDVSSKSVEAIKTPVNSGTTFNKSSALVNKSISAVIPQPTPAPKPPVPAKNPGLKTPTSSFTARVFSGANTSSKTLSPVKPSFPDLTAPQSTNGVSPSAAPATATSTAVKSSSVSSPVKSSTRTESVSVSTLKSSTTPQFQGESVSVSTLKSSTPSQSQSESVSVSTLKSSTPSQSQSESVSVSTLKSSTPSQSQSESVSVSTLKSSTPSQSRTESVSVSTLKSSTPSQSQTESVSVSTLKSSTPSLSHAPLDGLADSLLSQPLRSQTQVRTVNTEIPSPSPTLRSPLHTLQSSSRVISRDPCTVCGKPIAGGAKMILEELNIISHTSCFRCAVCRRDLGGLDAGKSLWVHRERVHCSNCFSDIRGQWYI